jgi:hypothetical protein
MPKVPRSEFGQDLLRGLLGVGVVVLFELLSAMYKSGWSDFDLRMEYHHPKIPAVHRGTGDHHPVVGHRAGCWLLEFSKLVRY